LEGYRIEALIRCTMRGLHNRVWPHRGDRRRQAGQAVDADETHIGDATVAQLGEHAHPVLRALTVLADPHAQHVFRALEIDPDHHVDRPVGHHPVPDLDP
jgi:hypothetical protein